MKNKLIWSPGPPQSSGIFWFNLGLKKFTKIMVAQSNFHNDEIKTILFGKLGSMPFVNDKVYKNCKHSTIPFPKNWNEFTTNSNFKNGYAWIKTPKSDVGFGILKNDSHNLYGTILWLSGDSGHGEHVPINKNYYFSQVKPIK